MQIKPKTPDPELTDSDSPELGEDFWRRAKPAREILPRILGKAPEVKTEPDK